MYPKQKSTISLLLKFFFISALCSCLVQKTKHGILITNKRNELRTAEGYIITKNGGFKLKDKFRLPDTSLLSVTKIYKLSCSNGNEWYKFFENGRVLHAYTHFDSLHIPVEVHYVCGYYAITGSILKIEQSEIETLAFGDTYSRIIIQGRISGDTIALNSSHWPGSRRVIEDFTKMKDKNGHPCYFLKSERFTGPDKTSW